MPGAMRMAGDFRRVAVQIIPLCEPPKSEQQHAMRQQQRQFVDHICALRKGS